MRLELQMHFHIIWGRFQWLAFGEGLIPWAWVVRQPMLQRHELTNALLVCMATGMGPSIIMSGHGRRFKRHLNAVRAPLC